MYERFYRSNKIWFHFQHSEDFLKSKVVLCDFTFTSFFVWRTVFEINFHFFYKTITKFSGHKFKESSRRLFRIWTKECHKYVIKITVSSELFSSLNNLKYKKVLILKFKKKIIVKSLTFEKIWNLFFFVKSTFLRYGVLIYRRCTDFRNFR